MKKHIIILTCMMLLCGCTNNAVNEEISDSESSEVVTTESFTEDSSTDDKTEPTTVQTTTEAIRTTIDPDYQGDTPRTFPVSPDDDPAEIREHYTFEVQSDGVKVYYDDIMAQLLVVDCSWAEDDEYAWRRLVHDNYDFDEYIDLFVPEEIGPFSQRGKYFRFKPEMGLFVIWNEMNELGVWAHTYYEDRTISTIINEDFNTQETKRYKWEDGVLVLFEREYRYLTEQTDEGKFYFVDFYNCDNGDEVLYRRKQLFYANGAEWPDVTELPLE